MDSVVVLLSRRMTCLDNDVAESGHAVAVVLINSEATMGIFWMVLRTGKSLWEIVTHVPGGSAGTGSVRFCIRPQVRPPS